MREVSRQSLNEVLQPAPAVESAGVNIARVHNDAILAYSTAVGYNYMSYVYGDIFPETRDFSHNQNIAIDQFLACVDDTITTVPSSGVFLLMGRQPPLRTH